VLNNKRELSEAEVVDLARARVKLRSRSVNVSSEAHTTELAEINLLLDQGHSVEARTRLATLISECRDDPPTPRGRAPGAIDRPGDARGLSKVPRQHRHVRD
jgi:hypothetical protein